jgi:hypothetical protein
MIRAVISLLLIFSMIFAFTAYLGIFKWQQFKVRKEIKAAIKAGVPDSLKVQFYLDELEANPTQITWIHSKEFRYKGEMYDIVSKQVLNGRVLLSCIHDVKESGLFAALDEMINFQMNADPRQQNSKENWLKLFHSLYFNQNIDSTESPLKYTPLTYFCGTNFQSISLKLHSPPPESIG